MKTGGKTSFTHPLDEQYQITLFPLRKQESEPARWTKNPNLCNNIYPAIMRYINVKYV